MLLSGCLVGDAMLPLADIFNHKASLVLLDDAWKVAEEMKTEQQGKGSSSRRSRRGVRQKGSGDGSAAAATGSDDVEHSGSEDAEVPGESAPGVCCLAATSLCTMASTQG